MSLYLYNTESRQKEKITPLEGNTIRMYTCGPTVYDYAHIGNFRTYVFEDLLRRTIRFFGMEIEQAMNLTDVDDKTIRGAIEKELSLKEYTQKYIDAFFIDLERLGIEKVEHYPAATDYIPKMISLIETLIEKKIAYKGSDGSIYYSIKDFPSYGRLSHLDLSALKPNASDRVTLDEYEKEHLCDFVLWKSYDSERDGKIFWESPFGLGRPGWHIECSAMAIALLGETIDIHVGGVDNMFPHHENEIAQSEGCTGKQFVTHWLHAEHLIVDGKKMSKSKGNFYTLRDLLEKGFSGEEVRYLLLQTHYRTQLNFTLEGLEAARKTLQRWDDFIIRLKGLPEKESSFAITPLLKRAEEAFKEALGDDLNISSALAALFTMMRDGNALCDEGKLTKKEGEELLSFLEKINRVIGVLPLTKKEEEVPPSVIEALKKREEARLAKNWELSDLYRDAIIKEGYIIEDTPSGARLKKK